MQTLKLPYEVLIRWNQEGAISGAHQIWAYKIIEDDGSIKYNVGHAESAGAVGADFPLHDAVNDVILTALQDRASEIAAHEKAINDLADANNVLKRNVADLTTASAAMADANEKMTAANAALAEDAERLARDNAALHRHVDDLKAARGTGTQLTDVARE